MSSSNPLLAGGARTPRVRQGLLLVAALVSTAPAGAGEAVVDAGPASASQSTSASQPMSFRLTRNGDLDFRIRLEVQTADDTAFAGVDYETPPSTFVFPAGASEAFLPVSLLPGSNTTSRDLLLHLLTARPDHPSFLGHPVAATPRDRYSAAAGDFNQDGRLDVALGTPTAIAVRMNRTPPGGAPSFSTEMDFANGASPHYVAAADVNGDGRPDLVSGTYTAQAGSVFVRLNTTLAGAASASFASPMSFASGGTLVNTIIPADLTGDGLVDLLIQHPSTTTVLVNTTVAQGVVPSFAPAMQVSGPAVWNLRGATSADVNGDGRLDLVIARLEGTSVRLNTGTVNGVPQFSAEHVVNTAATPVGLAAGDLDGDGRADLVISLQDPDTSATSLAVLVNETATGAAAPAFGPAIPVQGVSGEKLRIADLDGDGRADLAIGELQVLIGTRAADGGVAFAAPVPFPTDDNYSVRCAVLADFTGDGLPDLYKSGYYPGTLLVNESADRYPPLLPARPFANYATGETASGDFNLDGAPDLVLTYRNGFDEGLAILANDTLPGAGTAALRAPVTYPSPPLDTLVALDFNSDGKPDVAGAETFNGTVRIRRNNTAAGASTPSLAGEQVFDIDDVVLLVPGDYNNDGKPDLALVKSRISLIEIWLNRTAPGASSASFVIGGSVGFASGAPWDVVAADLDGNGRPELLATNAYTGELAVFRNTTANGATTTSFDAAQIFPAGVQPTGLAAGDLDGDGKADVVVSDDWHVQLHVLRNDTPAGASTLALTALPTLPTRVHLLRLGIGDVNGDGRSDVVANTEYGADVLSVLLNETGPGSNAIAFRLPYFLPAGNRVRQGLADINRDGRADVFQAGSIFMAFPFASSVGTTPAVGTIFPDTTPDPLVFAAQLDVAPSSVLTSNTVTLTGSVLPAPISIVNGSYSIGCTGTFTSGRGQISPGQSVCLRRTAPAGMGQAAQTTLTVGATAATWQIRTVDDRSPVPFTIASVTDAAPGSTLTTGPIKVSGITTAVTIAVSEASYSVGCGELFVTAPGTIGNGQSFCLRKVLPESHGTTVGAGVTVGTYSTGWSIRTADDRTPDPFAFNEREHLQPSSVQTSETQLITGLSGPTAISITNGAYSIGCTGTFATASATIDSGQTVCLRRTAPATASTTAVVQLRIGTAIESWILTTADDRTPNALAFPPATGLQLSRMYTSDALTVGGISVPVNISVVDGAYSIGCTGSFVTAPGAIANGQTVCLRRSSAAAPSTTVTASLTVGTLTTNWSLRTFDDDVPAALAFVSQSGLAPGAVRTSNTQTVTGISVPVPIKVTNGSYSIGCTDAFVATASTIANNQTVCLRRAAPSTPGSSAVVTLQVGGGTASWTLATAEDTTPANLKFTPQTGVAPGSERTSNTQTVSGISAPVTIKVANGSYSIGCTGTFITAAGTIASQQTVCLRRTAPAGASSTVVVALTVGASTFDWTITTADDKVPNGFTFLQQTNVAPGSVRTSNTQTITGISAPTPIAVANGSYSIGCNGTFVTTAGTINNQQTVCVRHTAANGNNATVTTTLNIGGVAAAFRSTTAP